jgi:hypothetical protein
VHCARIPYFLCYSRVRAVWLGGCTFFLQRVGHLVSVLLSPTNTSYYRTFTETQLELAEVVGEFENATVLLCVSYVSNSEELVRVCCRAFCAAATAR